MGIILCLASRYGCGIWINKAHNIDNIYSLLITVNRQFIYLYVCSLTSEATALQAAQSYMVITIASILTSTHTTMHKYLFCSNFYLYKFTYSTLCFTQEMFIYLRSYIKRLCLILHVSLGDGQEYQYVILEIVSAKTTPSALGNVQIGMLLLYSFKLN